MIPLHDDNPIQTTPFVTYVLIASCVMVFLWQVSSGPQQERMVYALGMIPAVLFGHVQLPESIALIVPSATLISSMFLHGGWMHLIGNMLYLWIFGNNIEDAMGHGRFVVFYVLCGIAAALAQAFPDPHSQIPMIGASGAISGVLGAYLLLFPHARVLVAIPFGLYLHTVRIKAGWVLGFWFVLQLLSSAASTDQQGGVAFGAHIGGFVAGMLLLPLFKRRSVRYFHPGR